jgi:Flp pilus assembly protein TadD
MKPKLAVICPSCGAQNRPTWDFCPRCSESLEGAREVEATASIGTDEGAAPSTLPAHAFAVVTLLALVLLGAAGWRYASQAPPLEGPNPDLFTVGTVPPSPPEAPVPAGPGGADYDAGRRLMNAGDLGEAVTRLAAAVAAEPDNAEFRNVYGFALLRSGDTDGAIAQHAEAARLDPRLRMQYARSLDVAGKTAEAVREYQEILASNPGAAVAEEDLGRLLFRSGEHAKAAPYLKAAVEARPDDPVLRQELAYSLEQAGDRKSAEAAFRQVLDKVPDATLSRGLLADNLYEQGRKDEAMAVLQEGLKRTPDAPLLQRQLGSVLEASGDGASAAAAYRAYVRLAPNAPDARDIATRAARLEGARRTP